MSTAVLERPKKRQRSARSLKREISNRLWQTDDPEILWGVLKFIRKTVPELPELPKELVKQLKEAKRDVEAGRYHTNEEMMKWFAERQRKH